MAVRVLVAAVLAVLALPAAAHAERAFSARFSANTQGDIAVAGELAGVVLGRAGGVR